MSPSQKLAKAIELLRQAKPGAGSPIRKAERLLLSLRHDIEHNAAPDKRRPDETWSDYYARTGVSYGENT